MNESLTQLRASVRGLLLDLDQRFAAADNAVDVAARHVFRLRFALARCEEQAHAALMQLPLYTRARYDTALSILRTEIASARVFIDAAAPGPAERPAAIAAVTPAARRAA